MSAKAVAKAATAAPRVVSVDKKYTIQSNGIWERIRRLLAVDPNRSNGVPLNPQFRYPTPGSLDPRSYDDTVTLPAGDIADNAYWKRDNRRNFPRTSVIGQPELVQLLTVGNVKDGAKQELIGEAGSKAIVAAREEGQKGVATYFREGGVAGVLGKDGLPPFPSAGGRGDKAIRYEMPEEQGFPAQYPCRTFA